MRPAPKIHWLTIEQAEEKLKQEPRKVLVDVYTDWCGWCKKMDKSTFTDPEVVALINKNFYAVKLDAEGDRPITIKGQTFTFKPEYKAHELAVALLNGQMSFPTTVYLDEQLNMLTPVPGYLDAKNMSSILRYFGENHHQMMTWQEFEKTTK
ncbi:thioredoxin fold domain-containing protein [Pontibacter saemangeumensis]|uniref:Thioredoxin fold domain-containing protein n=2 Tax=Pontibacter saemangeumensis TaxID=1084525 RepID=A0ABP8M801_9BACT